MTDDDGNTWEKEFDLAKNASPLKRSSRTASKAVRGKESSNVDFSLPLRPFMKRHAMGASGARKFAILVARMAKGDLKADVRFAEIEKQWNKMTQLMGGKFNGAHATRAKDQGWVDSPKHGMYRLIDGWRGALTGG